MRGRRSSGLDTPAATSEARVEMLRVRTDGLLADAAARLREARDTAARRARSLGRPILAWAAITVPQVDPVDAWDRGRLVTNDRALWVCPSVRFALAGVGAAWTITSQGPDRFARADAAWRSLVRDGVVTDTDEVCPGPGPLAMMGFAFAPWDPADPEWTGYPAAVLSLPRVCIASAGDTSRVTLAAVAEPDSRQHPDDDVQACLDACAAALGEPGPARPVAPDAGEHVVVGEFPAAGAWKESVRATARAIRAGRLRKVVLSRGLRVRAGRLDPARALRRLRVDYPECTLFAVSRGARCFLGATPERLVRLRGGEVTVAAIAGSAPRGDSEEEDRRLGERLRASVKDRIEHAIVVETLRDTLETVCAAVPRDVEPGLLKVRNVQHLCTPLAARLRAPRTLLNLAGLLHPTPAVGGVPRDDALRWIGEHEGWDRGWYGGPVGWTDAAGEGECAVAIRSALLHGTEALLFAGCGIVADSDADAEYAEASWKLEAVRSALVGTGTRGDD